MTMARMIATGVGILLIIAGLIVFLMHLWVYGVVLAVIGATVITIYMRKARQAQPH
jgi:branched-subunit amino acid transport protein AzlD